MTIRAMPRCLRWILAGLACAAGLPPPASGNEAAQQAYQSKCSVCHDSGTGQAPRIADRALWKALSAKGRNALYLGAIEGRPNTAMAPKGGFTALSDDQVRAIVDYMLAVSGNPDAPLAGIAPSAGVGATAPSAPATAMAGAPVSDAALGQRVAERLLAALGKPGMRLDPYDGVITIRGLGIKVEVRQGVTILSGAPEEAALIPHAETLAAAVPGVTRIVNRMVAAGMLDFD